MTLPDRYEQDIWILFKPADDVPGEWIAHCLTFDIVSQGSSLLHALEMIKDAVVICVCDDLSHGRNPGDRPEAPPEAWHEWENILKNGKKSHMDEVAVGGKILGVTTQLHFFVEREKCKTEDVVRESLKKENPVGEMQAWLCDAVGQMKAGGAHL